MLSVSGRILPTFVRQLRGPLKARVRAVQLLRGSRFTSLLFGLPLLLLLLLAGVARNGQPFERHRVALDASALSVEEQNQLRSQFRHSDEIRFESAGTRKRAEDLLKTGLVSAALSREPGRPALRLLVGARDVLFGWGLASALQEPVELAQLQVPRFIYLHFLFPGLLAFSMLTSGLLAMSHAVHGYRQGSGLPRLGVMSRSPLRFVASRTLSGVLLGLLQLGVLVLGARLLFELPLSVRGGIWLAGVAIVALPAFAGVGLALSSWLETETTTVQLIYAVQLPLILVSDAIFLLDDLPRPLRIAGELLPTTFLVRLLRQVLLEGEAEAAGLARGLVVLTTLGLLSFALGLRLLVRRSERPPPASAAAEPQRQ